MFMIYFNISTCICIYRLCTHIVLSCNVKKSRTTAKLSIKSRNMRRSYRALMGSSWSPDLYCSRFFTVGKHESNTRSDISWSVILYTQNIFSQRNLIARIEPMQDKYVYSFLMNYFFLSKFFEFHCVKHLRLFNIIQKSCSIKITNN